MTMINAEPSAHMRITVWRQNIAGSCNDATKFLQDITYIQFYNQNTYILTYPTTIENLKRIPFLINDFTLMIPLLSIIMFYYIW